MLRPIFLLLACCSILWLSAQDTDCSFGLVMTSATAGPGDEVTLNVTARNYESIAAMQYSHHWNPAELRFIEVLYNSDLDISPISFNLQPEMLNQGILNFAYLESSTLGLSLADGEAIYSLRFEVLVSGAANINLVPLGEQIEIVQAPQSVIENFYVFHGGVSMAATFPNLATACIKGQVCDDPDLGRITIVPTGTESLDMTWSSANGFSATGTEITGLAAGIYDLDITDGNGSAREGTFYVSSNTYLDIQLSVDADLCGGEPDGAITSAVSGGSGNYSYDWSNGVNTQNLVDIPAGTYTVTVTDLDLGCSLSATATVQNSSELLGFFTMANPSCDGNLDGSLTINVEGPPDSFPVSYAWSNGETTATISNVLAGFYSVTVADANGCEAIFTQVLDNNGFDFTAEVTLGSCQVGTGTGTGSISIQLDPTDYTFAWSNGETTPTVTGLDDGTYEVMITEVATGCSISESYIITSEELLVAWGYDCFELDGEDYSDITVIIWNPADGPYEFVWSNGVTVTDPQTSTITAPAPGTYGVTITSAGGCVDVLDGLTPDCGAEGAHLYLAPATSSLINGETRCFAVKADGFEQITGFQFSLNWDETDLDYAGLGDLLLNGLATTHFNTNLTADGLLSVSWLASDLINGETLPAGSTLFEVCLTGNTTEEGSTELSFSDFPTPLEVTDVDLNVLNTSTADALINLNGGGSGGGDLVFSIENQEVDAADPFCVSITAAGFVDIIGFQGTIAWDLDALEYTGVANINLENLSDQSFSDLAEAELAGQLRFLWNDMSLEGVTLSDDTPLFDLCFIATGEPGDYPIAVVDDPLPLQAINGDFTEVTLEVSPGTITINSQLEEPVSLRIGSAAVAPGETQCIPIETVAFSDIIGMQFSINWDSDRILFNELIVPETDLDLASNELNVTAEEGTMNLVWIADILEPVSLVEGTTIFELCFTAQTNEGPAGIIFSSQPSIIEFVRDDEVVPFLPVNGTLTVTTDGLVWPGDTNDDGIANNLDVFPLGLGFEATGAARTNPSTAWLAQYADAWPAATPSSEVNFRHADTNGDGQIDATDTLGLINNWGETVDGFGGNSSPTSSFTAAVLYVEADTLQAGQSARLPIHLGVDEMVEDAYGLAFTIRYDPEAVEAGSIRIEADGWLLGDAEDHLLVYRDYPADGRVEIGMVRTDGIGVDGEGQVAHLVIIMEDVILRTLVDVETFLSIEDVQLITAQEVDIPTAPRETTILVEGVTNTDEPAWASAIELGPNPTEGIVNLSSSGIEILELQLIDPRGRVLWTEDTPQQEIDLSTLAVGSYYLRITAAEGTLYEKLIKH